MKGVVKEWVNKRFSCGFNLPSNLWVCISSLKGRVDNCQLQKLNWTKNNTNYIFHHRNSSHLPAVPETKHTLKWLQALPTDCSMECGFTLSPINKSCNQILVVGIGHSNFEHFLKVFLVVIHISALCLFITSKSICFRLKKLHYTIDSIFFLRLI